MYVIKIFFNPWEHSVPNKKLAEILETVAGLTANRVAVNHRDGHYKRPSLGLVILDPSAARQEPSDQTVLATIAIGDEGESYLVNAVAKALYHRDHGVPAGFGVYTDLTQSVDGDFCYGFSTMVDGTIAGASGQTELQDAAEAGHAAVTFNLLVRQARKAWLDAHPDQKWFCNDDEPLGAYTWAIKQPAMLTIGGEQPASE